jgi:hypothetical protein
MTKQEEKELYDGLIKACGPDSYLGPALDDARAFVFSNIADDFPVALLSTLQMRQQELATVTRQLSAITHDLKQKQEEMKELDNAWHTLAEAASRSITAARRLNEAVAWFGPTNPNR